MRGIIRIVFYICLGFLFLGLVAFEPITLTCFSILTLFFGWILWMYRSAEQEFVAEMTQDPRSLSPATASLSVIFTTDGDEFVTQAARLVNRTHAKTAHVPFQSYWATYQDMTRLQKRWYFYWRDQARQKNYLPTSLSYIFVHIYELINQVGVKDAENGYDQLASLWLHYRQEYDNLDSYMVDWLADYVAIYLPHKNPFDVYHLPTLNWRYVARNIDFLLPKYLAPRQSDIPILLIDALVYYRIDHSKFYRKYPAVLETALQQVIQALDVNQKQKKKRLFYKYRGPAKKIYRTPFHSAVYAGSTDLIFLGSIYLYSESIELREYLTAVVKHTENRLRQRYQIKGKLKVVGLDKKTADLIDTILADAPTPQATELALGLDDDAIIKGLSIPSRGDKLAEFVAQGNGLAHQKRGEFPFAPWYSARPTYQLLSRDQKNRYIFWRDQVRQNRFPQTDYGYLQLYTCELINLIGVQTPQDGFEMLTRLWQNYGAGQTDADKTRFFGWLLAYQELYGDRLNTTPVDTLQWPSAASLVEKNAPDFLFKQHLDQPNGFIPITLLSQYLEFNLIKDSRFSADRTKRLLLEQVLSHVLLALNNDLQQTHNKTLMTFHKSVGTLVWVTHCHLAPPDWPEKIEFSEIPLCSQTAQFRKLMTAVIKLTENRLRETHKIRGRLRVTGLDESLRTVIDQAIAEFLNPNRTKKIAIDFARIGTLEQESADILDRLLVEEEGAEPPVLPEMMVADTAVVPLSEPAARVEPLLTDSADFADENEMWHSLVDRFSPVHLQLINLLLQADKEVVSHIRNLAQTNHMMTAVLFEELNGIAVDIIGDSLLDSDPPFEFVDPEYQEALESILQA